MSAFVLDCSVAVCWLFEDEATTATDALLVQLQDDRALVPNLWHLELGNVLLQSVRRNRLTASELVTRLELIGGLPIDVDTETEGRAFREISTLARSETLTTYDAAYLELAIRHGIPLATQDKALVRAANRVTVPTLPA